jgi:hypothetical protein
MAATSVIVPAYPGRRLQLIPDGDEGYAGFCPETDTPAVPVSAEEAEALEPCWDAITENLARRIGFTAAPWDREGALRRIGSLCGADRIVVPVVLFLPPGGIADHQMLLDGLISRPRSLVLLPTGVWMTDAVDATRRHSSHDFIIISDLPETAPAHGLPLDPRPGSRRRKDTAPAGKVLIRPAPGLTWSNVMIEIRGQSIAITAGGQTAEISFKKRSDMTEFHPLRILMTVRSEQRWRNPPRSDSSYELASRSFRRLVEILRDAVAIPDDPFLRSGGEFIPLFQIRLGGKLGKRLAAGDAEPDDQTDPDDPFAHYLHV